MSEEPVTDTIHRFLAKPSPKSGPLTNERSLQLELAYAFRMAGMSVRFEVPFKGVSRLMGSTCKFKTNLDLLVEFEGTKIGIELKVPMNGQHPETMYAFCADLEFTESIKRAGLVNRALCLMVTHDRAFWQDSGRGSLIHDLFRRSEAALSGSINKPTGAKDSTICLSGVYRPAKQWRPVKGTSLMSNASYLLIEV